ncbi:MAG: hypothetical protein JWO38_3014 [Gemmataceae bacterium]|nr:hypothetical protein [Gemmataceae bacterium]
MFAPPDDYLTADDLRALGFDPDAILTWCPWAVELTALDGSRCWAAADLTPLPGEDA